MRKLAVLKYDFDAELWVAVLESNDVEAHGDTPAQAVESLRYQANKHDLWPKD